MCVVYVMENNILEYVCKYVYVTDQQPCRRGGGICLQKTSTTAYEQI